MSHGSDVLLHWWAAIALAAVGIVVATPSDFLPAYPPQSILAYIASGFLALLIGGFYLAMLFEGAFRQGVRHRLGWLILLLLLPIFGAFIYFGTTRSVAYQLSSTDGRSRQMTNPPG